jgi:hypothetical protein
MNTRYSTLPCGAKQKNLPISEAGWIGEKVLYYTEKVKQVLRIYRSFLARRSVQQTMRFLKSILPT